MGIVHLFREYLVALFHTIPAEGNTIALASRLIGGQIFATDLKHVSVVMVFSHICSALQKKLELNK